MTFRDVFFCGLCVLDVCLIAHDMMLLAHL